MTNRTPLDLPPHLRELGRQWFAEARARDEAEAREARRTAAQRQDMSGDSGHDGSSSGCADGDGGSCGGDGGSD